MIENGNGVVELPEGWKWKTMGEVARVVGGSTPKSKEQLYWGGEIPWIGVADLTGYDEVYISEGSRKITEAGYKSCPTQMVPAGTVLFSSRAPIGYVAISSNPVCTSQGFKSFVPRSDVTSEYLYWWLKYARSIAESMASGTTFKELSGKRAAAIPIPVPPREEQSRIVEAITSAFAALEKAESALAQPREQSQRLLRIIAERATSVEGPRQPLRKLLREPLRNGHSAKASASEIGIRTLTLTAVTKSAFVDPNTKLTVADPDRVADLWLEPGDIFVQRSNTPELVGSAALYEGRPNWAIFPDLLIRVRTTEQLTPGFLIRVLQAPSVKHYFRRKAQGIAGSMPKISQGTLDDLEVPVPSLAEQQRIVAEIDQYEALIKGALEIVARITTASAALRRSILHRAMLGQLHGSQERSEGDLQAGVAP